MTEQTNIDSYCRVCMVQNPGKLISLFQIHDSEDEVIANMIIDCTEVMVTDDDNLPQNICRNCLIRLEHAYKLRKQCQRSDKAFRAMFLQFEVALIKSEIETCDSLNKSYLSSLNERHECVQQDSKDIHEDGEEATDETLVIEFLDEDYEDDDEYVDLNTRIEPEYATEVVPEAMKQLLRTIPESEFVSKVQNFNVYKLYYIRGERCCGCFKLFENIEALRNHCNHEHGNQQKIKLKKYQCDVCFQLFRSGSLLTEHKQAIKGKTMYQCNLCDAVLEDEMRFTEHIISTEKHEKAVDSVNIEGKYEKVKFKGVRCCGCDFICGDENEVQKHVMEVHFSKADEETGLFKCYRCYKGFRTLNHLSLHQSGSENVRSFVCRTEGCNYITFDKRKILEHITTTSIHQNLPGASKKRENDETSVENCRYIYCFARCCEAFDSQEKLEHHAESVHEMLRIQHMQDRKFTQSICMICLKGFESEHAYERHRSSDRIRKHVCLKCGAQYVSKSTLLQHERSECGKVAQHQCSLCDKTFVSQGGLRNHQEVHSQGRSHICGTCGRGFLRKGILKDHINTVHSKIRLFQCSLCPKSFTSRNVFQSHQMTHTKEKPYQCRHCEKRYYKTSDRTMHENQVHLGIRPFQCNFCTASFIRDRERRLHERTHTKAKLYNCDMCSEGYNKFADYKLHRMEEHGLETLRDLGPVTMAAVHGELQQALHTKNAQ